MKIAMMVRGYIPSPRPVDMIYAPIDLAVAIAEGLAARGHQVDYFGPLGTKLRKATVQNLNLRPLIHNQKEFQDLVHNTEEIMHYTPALWDMHMAHAMFKAATKGKYDILHIHHAEAALPCARMNPSVPVAFTMHDPVYNWYKEMFELYDSPNQHFISISDNQRRDAPDLRYAATVYNGVDVDAFSFSAEPEDYLLFAGRIVPEKGVKEAVQVAQKTGHRLLIIGPVFAGSQDYFDQYIKPHLNDKILYLGYIERDHLTRYYQKAKALLAPIQWEEPFGLTCIEAMACGTPVLALHRGSMHEIIDNGVTGYVVDSIGDMIKAVGKIDQIDRAACREHVRKHFSIDTMVDAYEAAFQKILSKRKRKPAKELVEKLRRVVPTSRKVKDNIKNQLNLSL